MTLHIADLLVGRPAFWGDSMTCRFGFMIAIAAALLAAPPAKAQAGGDVNGVWVTQAGDPKVHVRAIGGGVWGGVVLVRVPVPPATAENPSGSHNTKYCPAAPTTNRLPALTR